MILAFDLGTGGAKVCIFDNTGRLHSKTFKPYPTGYPAKEYHEQRPEDWWDALVSGTRELLGSRETLGREIQSIAISGQSLAVIPLDQKGNLLLPSIPIWSDTRAGKQTLEFFNFVDPEEWYNKTGNGFTPECYSIFKIMWYRDNHPDLYRKTWKILGSKDYLNYRLTGQIATDYSYASGSGVYDLRRRIYDSELLDASGIPENLLPRPGRSDECLGTLTAQAARDLALPSSVRVYCGGVDNSCMALGARNLEQGSVYLSLGSSAWIAVSSREPLVDSIIKPFVFDHVVPDMYTSATSIFSAGSSLNWFKETMAGEWAKKAKDQGADVFELLISMAQESELGARGVIFNPTLAGAPASSSYGNISGAFLNLNLDTSFGDLSRAVLEGITFDLYGMFSKLETLCGLSEKVNIVGGGSRSQFWRQLFAHVFRRKFSRISTDQDAAALGAAAVAAVGSGIWKDYSVINSLVRELETVSPDENISRAYEQIFRKYTATRKKLSEIGEILNGSGSGLAGEKKGEQE